MQELSLLRACFLEVARRKRKANRPSKKTARALAMEGLSIGLALLRRSTKAISPKRWSAMCL